MDQPQERARQLRRPEPPPKLTVSDLAVLTQYGRADSVPRFRDRPRWQQHETELSMLFGRVSLAHVTILVPHRAPQPGDLLRFTVAGLLRAAGFLVTSTPTVGNPIHISVAVPGGAVPWDDEQAVAFDRAFDDYEMGGG